MKIHSIIGWLWLALVASLLTAAPAHAFYNPQTGHWLSRDPVLESGFQQISATPQSVPMPPVLVDDDILTVQNLMIKSQLDENSFVFLANSPINTVDYDGLCSAFKKCKTPGSWVQKQDGVIPPPDGCSVPGSPGWRNSPAPPADFEPPCNGHDLCYSDCSTPKSVCDRNLFKGMLDACEQSADDRGLTGKARYDFMVRCNSWAATYYYAVKFFGCGSYKHRQKLNCHCSCSS